MAFLAITSPNHSVIFHCVILLFVEVVEVTIPIKTITHVLKV